MGKRVVVSSKLMEVQNNQGPAAHEVKYLLLLIIFVRGIMIFVSLLLNNVIFNCDYVFIVVK